ncbi:hypothetical protein [Maledivibacter halophilus]|uniref:Uncharacterized protein n=1 Tax=Maledivibacter halophilus TaxID=36842 RepID=A0A1T5KGM7_9FIRM|nr:hypothetical protein [Maledivibacter halophilus]SKC62605.1 hypothetical protein SAMN02194393_01769 [Maledivibacter halophilus]
MLYVFEGGSIVYDERVLTEEDKARAVAVEELPPKEIPAGKTAVIRANKAENTVWWEYVDSPQYLEFQKLETKVQGLQQALAEITMMMAGGE